MYDNRRVVITGCGLITPLGFDESTVWNNMLSGKTAISPITSFDTTPYKSKNAAEINNDELSAALKNTRIVQVDRTIDMAVLASARALEQARIISGPPPYEPADIATIFGTHGCFKTMSEAFISFTQKGPPGIRPSTLPKCIPNSTSSFVSIRYRLTGPNFVVCSACASSTTAIGMAYKMIKHGDIDKVLCGGSEAVIDPFIYSGWDALGVMSTNPDPKKACRPFDNDRDGCVLGEGAGALVLESLNSAQKRNAPIRAEIIGFGESSDAEHITRPSEKGQIKALNNALASAGIRAADIGFINAHGTATRSNDECESASLSKMLGASANVVPIASNKSFFGHLLGACGAVETIITVLSLENGKIPPNLNLDNPDPKCNLCFVGNKPVNVSSPIAMKNNFGFGGDNAVLILKKWHNK